MTPPAVPGLRRLFLAGLLRRRLASALSLLAIALGVALGLAVQLIHGAALDEFGRGSRLLAGEADLQVIGGADGFDEALYFTLAARSDIAAASPLLEIEAKLPGRTDTLKVLGIDLFQAAQVQSGLLPRPAPPADRLAALEEDALFLSAAARRQLETLIVDDVLTVQSGLVRRPLRIRGELPGVEQGQALAVMDIAAAQRQFDRLGRLSRIDLRLADGTDRAAVRTALQAVLPAGLGLRAPEAAGGELGALSRAYRVNLTMLAAIALLTGGFLVFSTQFLSVARRRREFALLRALGMARAQLLRGLLAEGAAVGLAGAVLGIVLGHALAALAFRVLGGDLGAGYFQGVTPHLSWQGAGVAAYLALGIAAGLAGTLLPARAAARIEPARALRAGEGEAALALQARPRWRGAAVLLALAAALCGLPSLAGIPVAGYVAVLLVLAAAILALPGAAAAATRTLGRGRDAVGRLARARLAAAPGQAVVAGAGVVASVALAAAMAIMVSSFRGSVDDWLTRVLPADLYLRASGSQASGFIDEAALDRIARTPGVGTLDTVRAIGLRLEDGRPPVTLIARAVRGGWGLPLVEGSLTPAADAGQTLAWLSEAVADRLGKRIGDTIVLPLAGRQTPFMVAGIWRDYARQQGAIVVERSVYRALSGDTRINDVAIRVSPGVSPGEVAGRLREALGADLVDIALPAEIRRVTLTIFDRTFLVTYLMEAVAIVIGLFGIATTFAALATARRGEFAMLRHLGLTRGEVGRLVACEGALTAASGVAVGLAAGAAIAWILIAVVNRQSFHWSMDVSVPFAALGLFALTLVLLAAAVANIAAGRAMRGAVVEAVKEDW